MEDLFDNADQNTGVSISLGEHTVRGEILRVVFVSQSGDYAVIKLLTHDKEEIVVVGNGTLTNVSPGEEIEAKGKWETHKTWGKQFKARVFKSVLPSTNEGLVRYLACGNFPGIGPKTAERIVETFGEETIHILDNYTGRLKEVPGLGKKKIAEISEAWQDVSDRREMDVFLQSLGIPTAYCNRIYKAYGDRTAAVIRNNPYQLAKDVNGIGFQISDKIAQNMGIEKTNPFRLASGISHTIDQLGSNGHTCIPQETLIQKASETLGVDKSCAEVGLQRAILDGAVIAEPSISSADKKMIYSLKCYSNERQLAEKLQLMLNFPCDKNDEDETHFLNPNLNEEQKLAVTNCFNFKISIITGGPGVGKTTTIDEITRQARQRQLKTYLAAPTGRAAKRMSEATGWKAKTIHRMLISKDDEEDFVFNEGKHLKCDLLIVDEVSMLDLALAAKLFSALAPDTSVVLVGDKDQLPSVGPGAVLHDLISCGCIPLVTLEQVYRQEEGSRIIDNSHKINHGQFPDIKNPPRDLLGDFYWIDQTDPEKIEDIISEMMTDRIPNRFGIKTSEIQVLTPMNKGLCGRKALNEKLQSSLNDIHKNQFKIGERKFIVGDRVMQVSNNYDKNVFNGDLGYILDINNTLKTFDVMYENEIVNYSFDDVDQIALAYAVTIHKSQGSEFPAVIIPLISHHFVMLQRNLLYTGVTRAKKLLILIGQREALERCINNNRPSLRCTQLGDRLKELLGSSLY